VACSCSPTWTSSVTMRPTTCPRTTSQVRECAARAKSCINASGAPRASPTCLHLGVPPAAHQATPRLHLASPSVPASMARSSGHTRASKGRVACTKVERLPACLLACLLACCSVICWRANARRLPDCACSPCWFRRPQKAWKGLAPRLQALLVPQPQLPHH